MTYIVHALSGAPISCALPSHKAALAWVREVWTREDGTLPLPVLIVAHRGVYVRRT